MKPSINVWVGNYGTYTIPNDVLNGVRMTKRGFPDKRKPESYNRFMSWVEQNEKEAKQENQKA